MQRPFDPECRRLWCHGPKPEYELDDDWADKWYIPARTIPLLRPAKDIIVLPGGNPQTKQFCNFVRLTLGINDWQVMWTTGKSYLLDDDIEAELFKEIKHTLEYGDWETVPYSVTKPFTRWSSRIKTQVFGDNEDWVRKFCDKAILHPNAIPRLRGRNTPLLTNILPNVVVPRGFTCTNAEELLAARDLLAKEGVGEFIVKPTQGTTGEGIFTVNRNDDLQEYKFPMGPVVLEEKLKIDEDENGIVAPSVQFNGCEIFGEVTDQSIRGAAYEGNAAPSRTSPEFQNEIKEIVRQILSVLRPQGPGGFDFLRVRGRPILIDPNLGRFTGAHPAKIFHSFYAPKLLFKCWKIKPTKDVWEFWHKLKSAGAHFHPSRGESGGVYPLCYLPDMWGMLIALGHNPRELEFFESQANACL